MYFPKRCCLEKYHQNSEAFWGATIINGLGEDSVDTSIFIVGSFA